MSVKDVWIYALPAEWEALGTEVEIPEEYGGGVGVVPFSYTWSQSVSGFVNDSGPYRVYNVQGPQNEVQDILDALTDVEHVFAWEYRGGNTTGFDSLDVWPTDPSPILAVMQDRNVYDEDGNITDTIAPTLENPNWGHVFQGQGERIFAGTFSTAFSEAFR